MLSFNCSFVGIAKDAQTLATPNFLKRIKRECLMGGTAEIVTNRRVGCEGDGSQSYRLFAVEGDGKDLEVNISRAEPVKGSLAEEDIHVGILDNYPELAMEFGSHSRPLLGVYLSPADAILFLRKLMAADPEALIAQFEQMQAEGKQ